MRPGSDEFWNKAVVEMIRADFAQLDPAAETIISGEQPESGESRGAEGAGGWLQQEWEQTAGVK
jgi:hypothetical protein